MALRISPRRGKSSVNREYETVIISDPDKKPQVLVQGESDTVPAFHGEKTPSEHLSGVTIAD